MYNVVKKHRLVVEVIIMCRGGC